MFEARSNSSVMSNGISAVAEGDAPYWKRVLDVACIFLALPALAPLLLVIAAGIKTVSRGPVFFRQDRIGCLGRRFTCFKFRTMHVNADAQVHTEYFKRLMQSQNPMTKLDSYGDPRLIPLGGFLRSTGLDELPQVFNVLQGDMSLVGPRPCTPNEYEDYLPWQKQRFATLPGLTGLWQVSGKNKTTFNEMIHLDILYIQNRSLWLDLRIMMKTFPVLCSQAQEMARARRANSPGPQKASSTDVFPGGGKAVSRRLESGRLAAETIPPDAKDLR
jgi:lipopolysaccharide/colanic/teichoic acid biosynthesis glycosyltransferase